MKLEHFSLFYDELRSTNRVMCMYGGKKTLFNHRGKQNKAIEKKNKQNQEKADEKGNQCKIKNLNYMRKNYETFLTFYRNRALSSNIICVNYDSDEKIERFQLLTAIHQTKSYKASLLGIKSTKQI